MVASDRSQCPACGEYVPPVEVAITLDKYGLKVDQGRTRRESYQHCDQAWGRTTHQPPRWSSSSPGHGR